jgi:hypothetical protein
MVSMTPREEITSEQRNAASTFRKEYVCLIQQFCDVKDARVTSCMLSYNRDLVEWVQSYRKR